jgi:GMP synthase (glutamine-hydrolysing)
MGTVMLETVAAARCDPLFGPIRLPFAAQTTHLQSVVDAPDGAVRLASSELEPTQALRFSEHVWGVQFHPEFSSAMMRGYIHGRADALVREGLDPQRMRDQVRPAPLARRVLSRFVRYARRVQ